jgi:LysR family glycine cleavage system transcriptional activator
MSKSGGRAASLLYHPPKSRTPKVIAPQRCPEDRISKPHPVNRRWLPLNALRAFDAVGQRLSFTAGAQALNVSQSAVSRHIISLEELIGRKLFDRSGSRLVLTAAGETLLPEVSKAFDRIEATINGISGNAPHSRPIRIHIPPSFLHQIALPLIQEFHAEHPEIRIDISSSHVTGLPATETDMAIVFDLPNVDDRVTDFLWMVRVAPVCAPRTATQHVGKPLAQFLADNSLLHVKLDDEPRGLLWGIYARQCRIALDVDRGLAFDTALLAVSSAMAADGVALADIDMFAAEIGDGRLVMPYDSVIEDGFGYYLKLRPEDLSDPAISLFRSWLIGRFAMRCAVTAKRGQDRLTA